MYAMQTAAIYNTAFMQAPTLRLTPKKGRSAKRACDANRPQLRLLSGPAATEKPVLLAGGDRAARDAVQRDLARTMPSSTAFEQAGAIWEVLVRAPEASMVIVSGELDDIPAESLLQMLMHKNPEVPVVCLDAGDASQSQSQAYAQAVAR
jgi:hypothetical protein